MNNALACEHCHALVHAQDLATLSASAVAAESKRDYAEAQKDWQRALELVPPEATQAEWIKTRLAQLNVLATQAAHKQERAAWAKRFGPLAPVVLFIAKGKFLISLLKLKFL